MVDGELENTSSLTNLPANTSANVTLTWLPVADQSQTVLIEVFAVPVTGENVTVTADNRLNCTMLIIVPDTIPPIASAGPDQTVFVGTTVHLNGEGSSDNIGIVGYTWSFGYNGTNITLIGAHVAFEFDSAGTYEITLNVTDAAGNWATDTVWIHVNEIIPEFLSGPTATAGNDEATIAWTTNVPTNYTLYWGTSASDITANSIQGIGYAETAEETLTGLMAETTYSYQITIRTERMIESTSPILRKSSSLIVRTTFSRVASARRGVTRTSRSHSV